MNFATNDQPYSSDTDLLSAEKKSLNVLDLFYGRHSRNFLAPAVNYVIFMAQRPSANIALLSKVYKNFIKFPKVLTTAGI